MSTRIRQSLGALLDPVAECFTPEVARRLVGLRADPAMQARVDELAAKANEGRLTAEEHAEYDTYIEAADIIGILQAKARIVLSQQIS
jgi:hypothetical protein